MFKFITIVLLINSFCSILSIGVTTRIIDGFIYPTERGFCLRPLKRFSLHWFKLPGVNNKRYQFHAEKVNWFDAVKTCKSGGGYLAVPHSRKEVEVRNY